MTRGWLILCRWRRQQLCQFAHKNRILLACLHNLLLYRQALLQVGGCSAWEDNEGAGQPGWIWIIKEPYNLCCHQMLEDMALLQEKELTLMNLKCFSGDAKNEYWMHTYIFFKVDHAIINIILYYLCFEQFHHCLCFYVIFY